eukprot:TRINITY_DN14736_c0_g1_i1.p1 TRINITY_DN14736_c0_g1~~TRINITY_DN14736_c0_g1_i1.p1  ORF type:complete len:616 (+),score=156.43 TRINITY_DN14736_c0_g1_i1:213-2060(+)
MDRTKREGPQWSGPLAVRGTPPLPRGGHSATFIENVMFVFGGSTYNRPNGTTKEAPLTQVQDDLHVFDSSSRTWSKLGPTPAGFSGTPPSPRYAHTATAVGKRLVVFGGFNGSRYLDDVHVLDVERMQWSSPQVKGAIPAARYAHSATLVTIGNSRKLYVFGGCGETSVFNELFVLDLATFTWLAVTNVGGTVPPARAYHTANLVGSKHLYIFGGRAGNKYFNDLYVLNLETLIWDKPHCTGQLPSSRAYHTCVTVNSQLVMFGGMDGSRCYNDVYVLETESQRWVQLPPAGQHVPSPRHKHTASMLGPTQMVIFAGMEAPPNGFNDIYVLDLSGPSFTEPKPSYEISSHGTSMPMAMQKMHSENLYLREELDRAQLRLGFFTGEKLDKATLSDLDELEKHFLEGLHRISIVKKEKMMLEFERRLREQRDELRLQYGGGSNGAMLVDASGSHAALDPESVARLQENVTKMQTENLKLRRRLKEAGIELMDGVKQYNKVAFGVVNTREFLPQQGQGVPSGGAAPLGMDMRPFREASEPLTMFEKRREQERRGVSRIPEEQRKEILKDSGVSDESMDEEARYLEQLNWNRLQSIASPTENPLPEHQRDLYRKILDQQ